MKYNEFLYLLLEELLDADGSALIVLGGVGCAELTARLRAAAWLGEPVCVVELVLATDCEATELYCSIMTDDVCDDDNGDDGSV